MPMAYELAADTYYGLGIVTLFMTFKSSFSQKKWTSVN